MDPGRIANDLLHGELADGDQWDNLVTDLTTFHLQETHDAG